MSTPLLLHARDKTSIGRIAAELGRFFAERVDAAAHYGPAFERLWRLAAERVRGGKLVRPLLLVHMHAALTADADDGSNDDEPSPELVRLAATLELLHFSFLLHDDVIDGDVLRRGRSNLIGALAAEATAAAPELGSDPQSRAHWARSGALLMGDLVLAEVHQVFARLDVPGERRIRLLDLLAHAVTESVAGEQLDVGLSDRVIAPQLETILEMSRLKTATYSFELPLRMAAALASAPTRVDVALATAGRHLGLAFQLRDDVLSVFGDPELHGKDAFSDLREGKETALIAFARMTPVWEAIEPHFSSPTLTDARAREVRDRLEESGARHFVEGVIDVELAALDRVLDDSSTGLPTRARRVLSDVADRLAERVS